MPKANKEQLQRRVHEVTQLLLSGAERTEIRQYATDKGWRVSERQLRRYMELAYKKLTQVLEPTRKQVYSRHVVQRRGLFARCLKKGDFRTAAQLLRDEAELQGLYPPTKGDKDPLPPGFRYVPACGMLGRLDRVVRTAAAQIRDDADEVSLLNAHAGRMPMLMPDTWLPLALLHVLTLIHVSEQLDAAGMCNLALVQSALFGDSDGRWDHMGMLCAFMFRVRREGWRLFTNELGLDGDGLIRKNYGACS